MRFLYSLILYFLTPFVLLRFWWKGRQFPSYRRIKERFCLQKASFEPVDIWVHAVSLGEVMAATPLIESLLEKRYRLLLTTTTATGSARVQQVFGNRVTHQFLPYDLPVVARRFFRAYQPKLGFIMETELWPNLIYEGHVAKVPLILGNARLSERSYKGYRYIKGLMKSLLQRFNAIFAQSQDDAQRFIALGAPENKVHVLGNLKFDLVLTIKNTDDFLAFKKCWGEERVVLIAASTHEHEEDLLLSQLRALQQRIPSLLFLIAPRHPERFKAVYELALQKGFHTGLRSDLKSLETRNEVVILDSLGELLAWFQLSHYAFVGGSFVPVGGHNVLEPIAMKVPVLTGPYIHNFKSICRSLEKADALVVLEKPEDLTEEVVRLHKESFAREKMVERAQAFLEKNKGALSRYLEKIEEWM